MSKQAAEEPLPVKDKWSGNTAIGQLSHDHGNIKPRTSAPPAVANFSDSLLFTYRGVNDDDYIYQCNYKEQTWSHDTLIFAIAEKLRQIILKVTGIEGTTHIPVWNHMVICVVSSMVFARRRGYSPFCMSLDQEP